MSSSLLNEELLVCWLNTLTIPSCLIVSDLSDLTDGSVIADLVQYTAQKTRSVAASKMIHPTLSAQQKIILSVQMLRTLVDENPKLGSVPRTLLDKELSSRVVSGNASAIKFIIAYIRFVLSQGPRPAEPVLSSGTPHLAAASAPAPAPTHPHPHHFGPSQAADPSRKQGADDRQTSRPASALSNRGDAERERAESRQKGAATGDQRHRSPGPGLRSRKSMLSPSPSVKQRSQTPRSAAVAGTPGLGGSFTGGFATPKGHVLAASSASSSSAWMANSGFSVNRPAATTTPVMSLRKRPHSTPSSSASALGKTPGSAAQHQRETARFSISKKSSLTEGVSALSKPIRTLSSSTKKTPASAARQAPARSSDGKRYSDMLNSQTRSRRSPSKLGSRHPPHSAKKQLMFDASSGVGGTAVPSKPMPLSAQQSSLVEWILACGVNIPGISSSIDLTTFLQSMKDGLVLCDLASVLEGQELSGVHRNVVQLAHKMANINRALNAFRSRKHMSPRYLFSADQILDGNAEVVFGLLEDVRKEYKQPLFHKLTGKKSILQLERRAQAMDIVIAEGQTPASVAASGIMALQQQYVSSGSSIGGGGGFANDKSTVHSSATGSAPGRWSWDEKDLPQLMLSVQRSLKTLGFTILDKKDESIWNDPFRNGILLGDLVHLLTNDESAKPVFRHPRTLSSVRTNFERVLSILRSRTHIPTDLVWDVESLIRGSDSHMYSLIHHILRSFPPKSDTTIDAKKELERSLIEWMVSMGCLAQYSRLDSVEPILPAIQNGTLLCEIVEKMTRNRLTGVFAQPRVEATCLSNIRRAMKALMGVKGMPIRNLHAEKEVYQGDRTVILSLLEDMWKSDPDHETLGKQEHIPPQNLVTAHTVTAPPTELKPHIPNPARLMGIDRQLVAPDPFFTSSNNARAFVNAEPFLEPMKNSTGMEQHPSSFGGPHGDSGFSNMQSGSNGTPSTGYLLGKWLASIGIGLSNPFVLEGAVVPEFRNGLILCKLVGYLEHEPLQGLTENPKSNAACLHNIRKALEVLRSRKNMPLDYLWSEAEVLQGRGDVICGLLEQVRRAYGQRVEKLVPRPESAKRNTTPGRQQKRVDR
eukprot:ANDGO_01442.mRNA.1 hypothetical protein H310_10820